LVYFDDVRLEVGLNYKDVAQIGAKVKQYLHSDCRLYPDRNSMSCDYFDDSGLRKKGWAGYCLEYDPKNPAACLLWYPIDKVESEEYEEGVALNIPKDLYYCVDALDSCNDTTKVEPEFFCNKFIKVDKEKYWYDRIVQGSTYSIPPNLLYLNATSSYSYFWADFGVNAGGRTNDIVLNQKAGSGYYGAYSSLKPPRDEKLSVGNVNKSVMNFVPFYGFSRAGSGGRDDSYFCRATINTNGKDSPFILENGTAYWDLGGRHEVDYDVTTPNVYDDCFVRGLTEGDYDDDPCRIEDTRRNNVTQNDVCCNWDPGAGRCTIIDTDYAEYCFGNSGFFCNNFRCVSGSSVSDERCNPGDPEPRYNFPRSGDPGTRCSSRMDDNQGHFKLRATDVSSDAQEVICLFDCFNHTNFYRVAQTPPRAVEAVKRLFTGLDKNNSNQPCYFWNGKSYQQGDSSLCGIGDSAVNFNLTADCIKDGKNERPDYNDSNSDYCIVHPKVPLVELNKNLIVGDHYELKDGGGWVTIRFASEVDKQQLPLRKYVINWDYKDKDGNDVTLVRNVNMNARPSINNGHVAYYFLDYDEIRAGGAACGVNYCDIRPTVTITDNWGAQNSITPSNGTLDKAIRIYSK